MIARFSIVLPHPLHLSTRHDYTPVEFIDGEYRVVVYPPVTSVLETFPPWGDSQSALEIASMIRPAETAIVREDFTMDGSPLIQASLLQIDFQKDYFERRIPKDGKTLSCDPPVSTLFETLNSVLVGLRMMGRAGEIKPLPEKGVWRVRYLDDDGNELERDGKNVLGHYGVSLQRSIIAVSPEAWQRLPKILPNVRPPPWRSLLLDAQALLPEIGPSIVLTATALELLIATALRSGAKEKEVSPDVWDWINERGDRRRHPSIEEQFDTLLRQIHGQSMKETKPELWRVFKTLKDARNYFAHTGKLVHGQVKQKVTADMAGSFIQSASEIATWIESFLPDDIGNKRFALTGFPNLEMQFTLKSPTDPESAVMSQIIAEAGPRADR
jgi:hypothetical protein